jgi:ribosomal protein S18 acetylase RimI-like enzyme
LDTTIRYYQPADQLVLFEISADTAFFGEPVEAFLEDRRLYNDAFTRYYTDFEDPFVWVANSSQGVIGFLLGCCDTFRQSKVWRSYIITKVLVRAISGKYRLGQRTASYAWGMLVGQIRGEEPRVDLNVYPAHLQNDVKQGYCGMGVGKRLIDAYLNQLYQLGRCGVHLATTSHNEAACRLYENIGFQLLESHPNRFWTKMLGYEVENLSYGLKLR